MRIYFLIVVLLPFLGGCAGVPEQTFNHEQHALNSIAVAPPKYDGEFLLRYRKDQLETVDIISPLPIGKLFAYVAKENRETDFTEKSASSAATFAKILYFQLEQRLRKDDYQVVKSNLPADDELRHDRNSLLKTIPASAFNGADALLETSGKIGFTAAGRGKPFQPTLWITVRLTASDGKVLLQDQILYNPPKSGSRGLLLHSTGDFLFEDREAILGSTMTAKALEQATSLVTEELLYLLRGPFHHVR